MSQASRQPATARLALTISNIILIPTPPHFIEPGGSSQEIYARRTSFLTAFSVRTADSVNLRRVAGPWSLGRYQLAGFRLFAEVGLPRVRLRGFAGVVRALNRGEFK
jgi:hypothetical protein